MDDNQPMVTGACQRSNIQGNSGLKVIMHRRMVPIRYLSKFRSKRENNFKLIQPEIRHQRQHSITSLDWLDMAATLHDYGTGHEHGRGDEYPCEEKPVVSGIHECHERVCDGSRRRITMSPSWNARQRRLGMFAGGECARKSPTY
jgi:hypothetical protein